MASARSIVALLLVSISLSHSTLLWRINVNPPAYLLGTIHVPHTYIVPSLSRLAREAFDNSTHFLPELDITNFFTFSRMRMCLNSYLSDQSSVSTLSAKMNLPGSANPFLDLYLSTEARRAKKSVISLETVDIYCEFGKFQADLFKINVSGVNPPVPLEEVYRQTVRGYNCDFDQHDEFLQAISMPNPDPALIVLEARMSDIVGRRDTQMANTIHQLLSTATPNDRFFFAVGYVHLMSPHGIIAKLRRDYQYSVTRLCSDPKELRMAFGCYGPSWCDLGARS